LRLAWDLIVPRHTVIAAGIVALLASAAPVAAYEPGWSFWQRRPTEPIAETPKIKAINRAARRAAKQKELSKDVRKDAEKLPPGPLHIIISIKKQQLTLYAGGVPVAHSQVSTGVPGHPTPQGVFSILEKRIYHESNLYSSAPMPYMQRITWSGVAMHQGVVPGHPASHGCIRLPGVRKAHVEPHQGRRARHHRAGRGRADGDFQPPSVHRAAAGRRCGAA